MKKFLLISLLFTATVFGAQIPEDSLKLGKPLSANDKGITFDTNDGASNKKLLVEKASKKLKYDGNTFQLGDGSGSSDKTLLIGGSGKSLKYNGTTSDFELDSPLKATSGVKLNAMQAIGTEISASSAIRATQGIKVGAGANEIRVASGNLEFSNDGAVYKKFGSGTGSGSGVNTLANPGFEDGISAGWTSSGGTFSQQTFTNGSDGNTKYARFISSGSGQYFQSDLIAWPDSITNGGQFKFKYKDGNSVFKLQVLDVSSNLLGEVVLTNLDSWQDLSPASFFAPTPGTQVRIRIISTAAGTINADDAYLGSNSNIIPTEKFTTPPVAYAPTFTSFGAVVSPNITYQQIADHYLIKGEFTQGTPVATEFRMSLPGGKVIKSGISLNSPFGSFAFNQVAGSSNNYFICGSPGDAYLKFCVQGASNAYDAISTTGPMPSAGAVYYFEALVPIENLGGTSEIAQTAQAADWFIDVNIGGGNPVSVSTSSYVPWELSTLDMVVNLGSASVQIPCSSTNVATGLTCSTGDEQVGVTFTNPETGFYEACAEMGLDLTNTYLTNQWIETNDSNTGIIQEGKSRPGMYTPATNIRVSVSNCGTFYFSDIKKRALRFAYEATNTLGVLLLDRDTGKGQTDAHITVRKLSNSSPRAILTGDTVTAKGASKPWIESGSFTDGSGIGNSNFCTTSNCTLTRKLGEKITNVDVTTAAGAGVSITFDATVDVSKVTCSVIAHVSGSTPFQACPMASVSGQVMLNECYNGGNKRGTYICTGKD